MCRRTRVHTSRDRLCDLVLSFETWSWVLISNLCYSCVLMPRVYLDWYTDALRRVIPTQSWNLQPYLRLPPNSRHRCKPFLDEHIRHCVTSLRSMLLASTASHHWRLAHSHYRSHPVLAMTGSVHLSVPPRLTLAARHTRCKTLSVGSLSAK